MSKKILVADDSVVIQKAIGITFAQEDFEVTFVSNGEEALQRAKEINPDLILADTNMPKLSGSDLCKRLRTEAAFQSTPIILLANNKETFTPIQLKSFGANDFVQKPFESTQLLDKAKSLLEHVPPAMEAPILDILSSSTINEEPPAIRRSNPKEISPSIPLSTDQQNYFQEKTSGESVLPPQMDSYSSMPSPGFIPNSDPGMDLLSNDSDPDPEDEPNRNSIIPDPDFSTKILQKPVQFPQKPMVPPTMEPSLNLSEKQIEEIVSRVFQSVIERIAWEVVPDLAERIIKEEIEKLTRE